MLKKPNQTEASLSEPTTINQYPNAFIFVFNFVLRKTRKLEYDETGTEKKRELRRVIS